MWIHVRPIFFVIVLAIAVSGGAGAASPGGYGAIIGRGSGVGVYTLNRIVVTRSYSTGAGFVLPGTISPGTQVLPPGSSTTFQLGWSYNWPDAVNGPNKNDYVVTFELGPVNNSVVPCDYCISFAQAGLASYAVGKALVWGTWTSSGYGDQRDHSFSFSGFNGSNMFSYCCNPDVTGSSPYISGNFNLNDVDVPEALTGAPASLNLVNGEVTFPVYGMMDFGDQGTGMIEVDFIYDPGPKACDISEYSLTLPPQFPDSNGGSFTVGVTAPAGCTWSAIIQSGYQDIPESGLSLVGGSAYTGVSGSGNGEVTLMEAANLPTVDPYHGPVYNGWVVNIAGQLLAISQPPDPTIAGSAGPYTLNRVMVTRTYGAGVGSPGDGTNPIGALSQTFPVNQLVLAYQAGWDYFWAASTGAAPMYRNRFVSVLSLDEIPASVTPGAQPQQSHSGGGYVPLADMYADWFASGYGNPRYHTLSTSGAVGSITPGANTGGTGWLPCQSPTTLPSGNGDLGCLSIGSTPPAIPQPDSNGEVHLVLDGVTAFGYDAGSVDVEVDLVYTLGNTGVPAHLRDWQGNNRSGALLYDPIGGQSYTAISNGDGTYNYVPNLFTPGFNILRSGDFNGDAKSDLIVYNSFSGLAYIGLGKGDGTFNFQSLFWSSGYDTVVTGDINGDHKTDVALYNSVTGTLYTGISNGTGGFGYQYHLVSHGFTFVRLADFTGDGLADLLLYNSNTGQANLGVGEGAGNFAFQALSVSPGYALADIGDLNGDGIMDIILYNPTTGAAATGIGKGTGGFTFTPLIFSPGFTSVRLADYTGDGKADTTVYNKNSGIGYFGTGTGTGTFNFQSLFWGPGYDSVEPEDVNADGKIDVVLYSSTTGTEYTGVSNGTSAFNYYSYAYWGLGKLLAQ